MTLISVGRAFIFLSLSLQYYEMSYGLNIEMHKQVTELSSFNVTRMRTLL